MIIPVGPPPSAPSTAEPRYRQLGDDETPPRAEREGEWYGWQTLGVDAASIALIALTDRDNAGSAPAWVGLGGFVLATPIVHTLHQNDFALASLGLRVGSVSLIEIGALVIFNGCFSLGEAPPGCGSAQIVGGTLAIAGMSGALASIVLDAVRARAEPSAEERPSFGLWADPRVGSAGVSLTVVR